MATKRQPPAQTVEAREEEMINLATNLAEKKLRDGTATSALILHYLKSGSTKDRLERKRIAVDMELSEAKTESIKSNKNIEEVVRDAVEAMKLYAGAGSYLNQDTDDYYEEF